MVIPELSSHHLSSAVLVFKGPQFAHKFPSSLKQWFITVNFRPCKRKIANIYL